MNIEGIGDLPVPTLRQEISVPLGTALSFDVDKEFHDIGAKIQMTWHGKALELGEVVVLDERKETHFRIEIDYMRTRGGPSRLVYNPTFRTTDRFYFPDADVVDWQFDVERLDERSTRIHAHVTLDISECSHEEYEYDLSTFYLEAYCAPLRWREGDQTQLRATVLTPGQVDLPPGRGANAPTYDRLYFEKTVTDRGLELEYLVDVHSVLGPPNSLALQGSLRCRDVSPQSVDAKTKLIFVNQHTVMLWPWSNPKVRYSSEFPEGIPGEFDLKAKTEPADAAP